MDVKETHKRQKKRPNKDCLSNQMSVEIEILWIESFIGHTKTKIMAFMESICSLFCVVGQEEERYCLLYGWK